MNVLFRTFAVAAALALATAPAVRADEAITAEVSYQIFDFYHPTELLQDGSIRVTATNQATGETFTPDDHSGVFLLPVGTYTFTGRSQWCYLAQSTIDITASTTDIALYAGCE